ncbi:MAG: hypothetical protein NTV34_17385, partial [Proteobacteria bacterium]|nr:hypothetical protein [Pseudomonadota bacterium]
MNSICHFLIAIFSKLIKTHLFKFALPIIILYQSCTTPSPNPLATSDTHATTSANLVPFKYLDDAIIV